MEGSATHYLYDGDQVIAEYGATGTLLRRYVYGPGIDEPIQLTILSATYTYHFDAQGSVVVARQRLTRRRKSRS